MTIQPSDIMDTAEVAAHFGVSMSSINVAMSKPDLNPRLARALPQPLRRVGKSWVWRRSDIEAVDYSMTPQRRRHRKDRVMNVEQHCVRPGE